MKKINLLFRLLSIILLLILGLQNCTDHSVNSEKVKGNLFPIKDGEKWGYMDSAGTVILSPQFGAVEGYFISGYSIFKKGNKYGLIDSTGNITVHADYDKLTYYNGSITWAMKNGKWGAIDIHDLTVIPFIYDTISYNMDIQPMLIKKAGKWIYINKKGEEVFNNLNYEETYVFSGSLALARKNGLYGYINKKGEWTIPAEYEKAEDFNGDKTIVYQSGSYYIIDTTGKQKLKIPYSKVDKTNKEFAKVLSGNKWGVIDMKGVLIADTIYDELGPYFVDGYSWGWKEGKCFILSDKGKIIPLPEIDIIWSFDNGTATFRKGKNYGYCDTTGKITMIQAASFSEGLAAANNGDISSMGNGYGYIDWSGKVVIPYQYEQAFSFKNGLARIEKNGKMGYINKTGKIVWMEK